VLLERVVDAGLEVGLGPVVIDPKPAADVEVLKSCTRLHELGVDARRLVQRPLHDADVRNLAAQMEVQQLEAVLHAERFQLTTPPEDLSDRQTELRAVAA